MTMSPTGSTPSIRIYDSASLHRYPIPHHHRPSHPSQQSGAMAIPRAREAVPPPLPPPRYIGEQLTEGQDAGWQWGNTHNTAFGTIKSGSSLLGGAGGSRVAPRDDNGFSPGRETSTSRSLDDMSSADSDEDHHSGKSRPSLPNYGFTSERQLGQKALENSSHAYDKQLLSKIGGPNTPTRTTAPPLIAASAQEPATTVHSSFSKLNGQLKPLSVPDRLHPSIDSPVSRWPQSGAISPGYSGFRSPVFDSASADTPPRRFGSISSTPGPLEDSVASLHHRGSYDHSIFPDPEFGVEESGMRELNINDRSPAGSDEYQMGKAGLKRRASSPPTEAARDDRPTGSGTNDLYHRRSAQMLVSRNSPVSRFQANQGSLSSASSLISQRTASFASSYGFSTASSMTSYSGDQRLSPSALSPSADAELGPVSPYAASQSLNPSPRGSLSRPHHQRGLSENEHPHLRKMSTDSILHSRQNSVSGRMSGSYICECCPKKPKKFESEDELRIHELEKQYTCQYCPNRFKNKNEAERHQNSLHLRRHSWSCAALAGVRAAFHSPAHSTASDVCGYCGEEFPNPANWDLRTEHLNHVHKFGECNQAKKFFRADHFRQHLKHSHAGTSGKWTNMLENACMKDEPPPKERVGSVSSIAGSSVGTPLAPKPGVIDEERDES